jgi:ferredoxin
LKVCVEVLGLTSVLTDAIISHIRENWSLDEVFIVPSGGSPEGELEGYLLISGGRSMVHRTAYVNEELDVEGVDESLAGELFFHIDAKLGRLTRSDISEAIRPLIGRDQTISRRNLLLGAARGFASYSDAPLTRSCEARYGCSRCVEICPAKALERVSSSVVVDGTKCTRCGLCAATCPIGAIQMPRFSESSFLGLLDSIDQSSTPKKVLVLTCDGRSFGYRPWAVVEEIPDVGCIGLRQLALAATSSLGAVLVCCADGKCFGNDKVRDSVATISAVVADSGIPFLVLYAESRDEGMEKVDELHDKLMPRLPLIQRTGKSWNDYVAALDSLAGGNAASTGLGLTNVVVSDSCTLCGSCVGFCPHTSLRINGPQLLFLSATCTGCGYCVQICPEHSIVLTSLVGRLPDTRKMKVVREDVMVNCTKCGRPLGTEGFLNRVSSLMGTSNSMLRLCPECKARLSFEGLLRKGRSG